MSVRAKIAASAFAATTVVACTSAPPPVGPSTTPSPTVTSTSEAPAPSPPTTTTTASALATVHPLTAAELGPSWRPGCPLGPEALRRVELNYVGFDDQIHRGDLIVHQELVAEVIAIFGELERLRFPIERMRPAAAYPGAEDELSMRDNNTSAFNCRGIPGSRQWSFHAYGRAIDVNPLLNPFVNGRGEFQPANAAPYLDRGRPDPGMLHRGDAAVRVFTDRGWRWGGDWRTPLDYQHFERR